MFDCNETYSIFDLDESYSMIDSAFHCNKACVCLLDWDDVRKL